MRILYLFGESSGGIANYVRGLTIDSKSVNFLVFTTNDEEALFERRFPGFRRIKFNFHSVFFVVLYRLWILSKEIRSRNIDIVNSHALKFGLYMVILRILVPVRIRFVYTDHGSPYLQSKYLWKRILLFVVEYIVTRFSDARICIRDNEYKVWNNKVSNVVLVRTRVALPNLARICKKESTTSVIMVGTIYDLKNPCFFKEVAELFKNDDRVNFKWIGPEGSNVQLNECITQNQALSYLGEMEFRDVQNVMCESDILLLTSEVEVTPLVMFEAFSSETLVISNDWLGVDGFIVNGENGFILSDAKSVATVIQNYSRAKNDFNSVTRMAKIYAKQKYSNLSIFREEYNRVLYG